MVLIAAISVAIVALRSWTHYGRQVVITYEGTEEVHTLVIGEQLTRLKAFT